MRAQNCLIFLIFNLKEYKRKRKREGRKDKKNRKGKGEREGGKQQFLGDKSIA